MRPCRMTSCASMGRGARRSDRSTMHREIWARVNCYSLFQFGGPPGDVYALRGGRTGLLVKVPPVLQPRGSVTPVFPRPSRDAILRRWERFRTFLPSEFDQHNRSETL